MRIGINLLPYSPGGQGGAEVYISNVVKAFGKIDLRAEFFIIGVGESLKEYGFTGRNFRFVKVPGLFGSSRLSRVAAEQAILPLLCLKYRLDCLVSNYVVPLLAPTVNVVVVHDLLYKAYPRIFEPTKLAYWGRMIPASIARSRAVVTVSNFSKNEIKKSFPEAAPRLFVTVEGVRPSLLGHKAPVVEESSFGVQRPYILCVSSYGRHKNVRALVEAFALISPRHPNLSLVLVGSAKTPDAREYKSGIDKIVTKAGLSEKVKYIGYVSDNTLAWLYKNASALVLPSLYEGFGLPIIEAQSFGCPVACSNVASMPEVAGKGAVTFDPFSVDFIAKALEEIITQPELKRSLQQAGYENVKRFSWEQAAKELWKAIEFATGCSGNLKK
jgi:glycosyltransferase involved in cell wall biosynthesis